MRQIQDDKLLKYYLKEHNFDQIFETKNLEFHLYEYEKGEIINRIYDSASYLQFIVSGAFQIYALREDGSRYPICIQEEFTVLGDMEFCGETSLRFFVEATKPVHCIQLPLQNYHAILLDDNSFLRFLLHSVAHKMALFALSASSFSNLEEKLLYYFEHECPDHQFKGVEAAATHLRCSRRQLQRLLKDLCARNVIVKVKKGEYKKL